jgi:hypothetical protein
MAQPQKRRELPDKNWISSPDFHGDERVTADLVNQIGGVPELSTWATMLIGFAGLSYFSFRKSRGPSVAA